MMMIICPPIHTQKHTQLAEAELDELNRTQAQIRQQGGDLKKQSNDLKEAIASTTTTLEEAKEECERVRGQIVRSPERVRKDIATAAK